MRRKLFRIALVAGSAALIVAAVAIAKPTRFQVGNLYLQDNGTLTPTRLPRHTQAPVTGSFVDEIGTVDGSHPPAFRHLDGNFDRNIEIHADGLPTCSKGTLEASSTATVRKACGDAIIATGQGEVEVAFPEQAPFRAKGPITLFYGGDKKGVLTVYVHAYVDVPAPTAIVTVAKVTRVNDGHYGIHIDATVPKIAGGAGSPTAFSFVIDRKYEHGGKRVSFLTASCPTGHYFAEGKVEFSDETTLQVAHDLPCQPIG